MTMGFFLIGLGVLVLLVLWTVLWVALIRAYGVKEAVVSFLFAVFWVGLIVVGICLMTFGIFKVTQP